MSKSKVKYTSGQVYSKSVPNILTQHDAWAEDAKCGCGINCCDHTIHLPINDASSTASYDAWIEFVNVGGTIKLRIHTDLGAGPIVKEVTLA
jgi:hypothetical protein